MADGRTVRSSSVRRRSDDKDRKSTRLNSSHVAISYAVFCLEKKREGRRLGPHCVRVGERGGGRPGRGAGGGGRGAAAGGGGRGVGLGVLVGGSASAFRLERV